MAKYSSLVKQKLSTLTTWKLEHVPRESNERADSLAVVAASLPIKETIGIVGPFPTAPAQKKLLFVATDYFSNWI